MRDILDLAGRWIGTPAGALVVPGNKAPVVLDEALTILRDSGPVTVAVLANDTDPEGQPLTLVSASAALGTAVAEANNTVTYTPPPGIAGFDTVVYLVADAVGQTRAGQINVTISEPQLSIAVTPNNTLVVNAGTGTIDITVTDPAAFAGAWQVATADLAGGPVNLVPPAVSGTLAIGQVLTALPGLWVYDTGAGVPVEGYQWRRNGADIAGATGTTHAVVAADIGPALAVAETLTDGYGQRTAVSAAVSSGFSPQDDTALIAWWDADDAATITESAGLVLSWADKAGGAALTQTTSTFRPASGARSMNGRNVLDFNGTRYLERGALALPASGDIAFHMALAIDGTASAFAAALAVEAANDFQIDANHASQFDGRLNMTGIGTSVTLAGGPFSGGLILSVVFDRTGAGQAAVFVANVSRGAAGYATAIDPAVALHVMTNRSKNAWLDGAVAELIVTGNIANRAQHHAYLAAKWGLS